MIMHLRSDGAGETGQLSGNSTGESPSRTTTPWQRELCCYGLLPARERQVYCHCCGIERASVEPRGGS